MTDRKPQFRRWIMSLAAACATASCGDGARNPTEPALAAVPGAASVSVDGEVVGLLKRTEDLAAGLSASATIGPRGGHLQLTKAGIRVDFPRGAVHAPTRITVTAVPGRTVAYRFEPHGLAFNQPVVVSQSLRNTTAWRNAALASQLQGSYFERLLVDRTESFARSLERRPARLRELTRELEFSIEHFSGYMVSTGKASIEIDLSIEIQIR